MERRTFAKGMAILPFGLWSVSALTNVEVTAHDIGFAPPLNGPLTSITQTEMRSAKADDLFLRVMRRFYFERLGRGFRMTSTMVSIDDTAPPRLSAMVRAGVEPLRGLTIGFIVDANGHIMTVEDLAGTWARVKAAIDALLSVADAGSGETPLLKVVAGLGESDQRALLINEVRDVLRYAGRKAVSGSPAAHDMMSILENHGDGWQTRALVNPLSGISWQLDKQFVGAKPPRRGIVGSMMRLAEGEIAPALSV